MGESARWKGQQRGNPETPKEMVWACTGDPSGWTHIVLFGVSGFPRPTVDRVETLRTVGTGCIIMHYATSHPRPRLQRRARHLILRPAPQGAGLQRPHRLR